MKDTKVIRLSESELRDMVCESVKQFILENEEDEFWGGMKSLFTGAKNGVNNAAAKVGNAASRAGAAVGNAVKKGANAVGNAANQAGAAVKNRWQAGEAQSAMEKQVKQYEKIIGQLEQWQQNGMFTGNRQANSCVTQLINALNANIGRAEQGYGNQYGGKVY